MNARRAAGLIVLLCATAIAALAIPWFRAALPDRNVAFAGPEVAPVLWALIPLAIGVALPVISVARRGWLPDDVAWRSGLVALASAVLAFGICTVTILWPEAQAVATGVPDAPPVPLSRQPAGFVAAGAMAGAAALLCAWLAAIIAALRLPQPGP